MAADAALAAVLKQPFAEQVAFFRQKLARLMPTARWDDLWQEQHDRAFMVAGAAKADLLVDLAGAVDKAITEGETLDGFRKRFAEIVERNGWHGWTGETTAKGRAWRTQIIYETNLMTSYAAGRYAQLKQGGYAFWIYKHSDFVQRPRPHHVALDGITRPPDDPFWAQYYPPNGWGCRCRVVGARGEAAIKRLGGSLDKPLPDWVGAIDPKSGAPVGIDKGFAYAPGARVADTVNMLANKLNRLPPQPAIALIQSWIATEVFAHWFENPQGHFPLVRLSDDDASALGAGEHVRTAYLSAESARKQARSHPDLMPGDYADAQRVIDAASVKVLETQPTGTRDMIYVLEDNPAGYVHIVKTTVMGGELWVQSFYRLRSNDAMRDREIRRLLKKGEKK